MSGVIKGCSVVFFAVLFCLGFFDPALAQSSAPDVCKIGIFVVDMHDLDVAKKTFGTNFWVWSICATEQRQPLKSMEFVNANSTSAVLDSVLPRGGAFWSSRKISGAFRDDFDVRNFPFDRHDLTVSMEEGVEDTRQLVYEVDQAKSGYDPRIAVAGWRIAGFRLVQTSHPYATTFGDPSLPANASAQFSRIEAHVQVLRDSYTSFLKMASVVYVAATLALLSFLFYLDAPSSFGSRISFLAGSLFATVINMRVSSAELGSHDGMTLIDLIHVTSLILIISATILTIIADRRLSADRGGGTATRDAVRRFDLRNMIVCGMLFVAANIALIAHAAYIG